MIGMCWRFWSHHIIITLIFNTVCSWKTWNKPTYPLCYIFSKTNLIQCLEAFEIIMHNSMVNDGEIGTGALESKSIN